MLTAYYNENDPKAVAWLRELITGGWHELARGLHRQGDPRGLP
jgi:hypothetical protein